MQMHAIKSRKKNDSRNSRAYTYNTRWNANNRYKDINAKITIPPLAIALNDQQTSLTRAKNCSQFLKADIESAKALNAIKLLSKHIADNSNYRSRTQFDIS